MRTVSTYHKKIIVVRIALTILHQVIKIHKKNIFSIPLWKKIRAQWLVKKDTWHPKRMRVVDGMYYWNLNIPGFPSKAFTNVIQQELKTLNNANTHKLASLIFAITKKCSLNCQHCFEWDEINKKEVLETKKVYAIVENMMQSAEPAQLLFSGGEPMIRYRLIVELIEKYKDNPCDFWIITSGKGVTATKFKQLKEVGLTGVIVSLDHYIEEEHNHFRGDKNSFEYALESLKIAKSLQLATAVSLCPQKGNVNQLFLDNYSAFAKYLKVDFIQLMEPRALGKYQSKDIQLLQQEQELLEAFYTETNTNVQNNTAPIIAYPDFTRRKQGCAGMKRLGYIDTNGVLNPCPFCKQTSGGSCGMKNTEKNADNKQDAPKSLIKETVS